MTTINLRTINNYKKLSKVRLGEIVKHRKNEH
jgi:hypothetical protein